METQSKVIELSEKDEQELIDISSIAFFTVPHIPALIKKPKYTKTVVSNLYYLYKGTGKTQSFGIKKDNKLVCVGFCIDSDLKPRLSKKIKFGFVIFRTLGIKGIRQFLKANKKRPKYDNTCLELMLYGTLPSYQKQGFGRQMINFLYDFAKKNNYGGVTGVTNSTRPAFKFYMRTGWIVDKEFFIENYKLCWVRKLV